MKSEIVKTIENWLIDRLSASEWQWLQDRIHLLRETNSNRDLHITLGLIPRKLPRVDLSPTQTELITANSLYPGWTPTNWSIDATARILILRIKSELDSSTFGQLFKELCKTADLRESITLYSGFFLFPKSDILDQQIGEGLRTNIKAVFEAIAHQNPYPREHFDQNRWNHMCLKALFIESSLHPIQGLDERANMELATILIDYAKERRAAGRPISPELWRCIGPFAQGDMLVELHESAKSNNTIEQQAALLALSKSPDLAAKNIIDSYPDTAADIQSGVITWSTIFSHSTP